MYVGTLLYNVSVKRKGRDLLLALNYLEFYFSIFTIVYSEQILKSPI